MKAKIENAFWIVFSFLTALLALWLLRPELIERPVETKKFTDLSATHGVGYQQEGNTFTVTEEESWYFFDMEQLDEDYSAVNLYFDPAGFTYEREVSATLYTSYTGLQENEQAVHQILHPEDQKLGFKGNFGKENFLRIAIHTPVGESYVLSAIAIEQKRISPTALGMVFLTGLTALFYGFFYLFRLWRILDKAKKWSLKTSRLLWEKLKKISSIILIPLENIVDKKQKRMLVYLIPQAVYLIKIILYHGLHYATNDDIVINSMAAGGWGEPTQYLCIESPILGHLTRFLFLILPNINWLGIIYITLMLAGFVMIDILLSQKECSFGRIFFMSAVVWNCFFMIWNYFTFTVIAYTCAIAGMLWCMDVIKKRPRILTFKIVPGLILLTFSILIRRNVVYSLLIVAGFYQVFELIFKKNWRLMLFFIFILVEVAAIKQANNLLNLQSEHQIEYHQWNSARSAVGDYLPQECFTENTGWTEADIQAFYGVFQWDRELYSTENLRQIADMKRPELWKHNLSQIYLEFANIWKELIGWNNFFNFYFILFAVTVFSELFYIKGCRIKNLLIIIGALSVSFLFFILGRMVYRILMPSYVFAILCMFWISEEHTKKGGVIAVCLITLLLMDTFLLSSFQTYQLSCRWVYDKRNIKVLDYFKENKDKLFLPCDIMAYSLEMARDVLEFKGKDYTSNLIGNWNIYSDSYYKFLEKYGVKNPDRLVLEIPDSSIIRLVTTGGQGPPNYIVDFIEERSGLEVIPELEKTITDTGYGDWNIYFVHTVSD